MNDAARTATGACTQLRSRVSGPDGQVKSGASGSRRRAAADVTGQTLGLHRKPRSRLRLQIYSRNEKFGELEIGRGSLRWWSARSPTEHRIPWARFAQMMDDLASRKK